MIRELLYLILEQLIRFSWSESDLVVIAAVVLMRELDCTAIPLIVFATGLPTVGHLASTTV